MTPAFVIDSSLAMTWCFLDEATPATRALLDVAATQPLLAPAWLYLEISNALVVAERKGCIDNNRVAKFIVLIEGLDVVLDHESPARAFDHLMPLCRAHRLSSYDAVYLDLAFRRQLPLATLDDPLRKAAKKLGVKLLGR